MKISYIYYTGVGAKKSGKHSIEEFLKIMRQNYGVECSHDLHDQEYEPCIEKNKMSRSFFDKYSKNKFYRHTKKQATKFKKLFNQCKRYKKTAKNRKCNLDEFIDFSGAIPK
jgi:hypothetical protein